MQEINTLSHYIAYKGFWYQIKKMYKSNNIWSLLSKKHFSFLLNTYFTVTFYI